MTSSSRSVPLPLIQHKRWLPWLVCFSAILFFFFESVQMFMFNTLAPELMKDFATDASGIARISASYYFSTVLFLLPAGIMIDRFSTKKIIISTMSISIVGTFLFASASNILMAEIYRFCAGIGGAFTFICCIRLLSRWFPPSRMAFLTGLMIMFAQSAGIISQMPFDLLMTAVGWRTAILIVGAMGVVFLLIIMAVVQDHPPGQTNLVQQSKLELNTLGFWLTLKQVLTNLQNWLVGIFISLLNMPVALLGSLWGILYLVQAHGLSRISATFVSTLFYVGVIIGAPLNGWLSDTIRSRKLPMCIGAILGLIVTLMIMYTPDLSVNGLAALFMALGLFSSVQIIGYPMITESNLTVLTGTSISVAALLVMGGNSLFQILSGWLIKLKWDGKILNNVPQYSIDNYHIGLILLPIGFILGLIAALLTRESYKRKSLPLH